MLKKTAAFLLLAILLCCSKDNKQPSNEGPEPTAEEPVIEQPKEEEPPIIGTIPDSKLVTVDIELPPNKIFENFKIIDDKGRETDINSTLKTGVEENTLVMLVEKNTDEIIYIGYFDNSTTSSKTSFNSKNQECTRSKKLSARSTAEWILAQSTGPYSMLTFGGAALSEFGDILRYNALCEVFTETQIANTELQIIEFAIEGVSIIQQTSIEVLKLGMSVYTLGFGTDCIDIAFEEFESKLTTNEWFNPTYPEDEREKSLEDYNENITDKPYLFDEFNNWNQNGIIITSATSLNNDKGEWLFKLKAFNSSPLPLGLFVGSSENSGVSFSDKPITIIGSSSSTMVNVFRDIVTCEGLPNIINDLKNSQTNPEAIQGSLFEDIEFEAKLNPIENKIYFIPPSKNRFVKAYYVIEMLSGFIEIFMDIAKVGDEFGNVDRDFKYTLFEELTESLFENSEVSGMFLNNNPLSEENYKLILKTLREYIGKVTAGAVVSGLKEVFKEGADLPNLADVYNLAVNTFDYAEFINNSTKPLKFEEYIDDYEFKFPDSDINSNVGAANNPTPADGVTNQPTSSDLAFEPGLNTPDDATYKIYFGITENLTEFDQTSSPINTDSNTTYYWKVETISNEGVLLATSETWSFTTTTEGNETTFAAFNPIPENNSTDHPLNGTFSFTPGDNTPSDATFRIFYSSSIDNIDQFIDTSTSEASYSNLLPDTTYFWIVETFNAQGEIIAVSDTWSFNTENNVSSGGVYEGDVELSTQQEVDDFGANNYEEITGKLEIKGLDISNLNALSNLKNIGLTLAISNTNLQNLSGLNNLTSAQLIGISGNPVLASVVGLESITSTGELIISGNALLSSLQGFINLKECSNLYIRNNQALSSLAGLNNLMAINGILVIEFNSVLTDLMGLQNISSLESLTIETNAMLNNLNGLNNLSEVRKEVYIFTNNSLKSLTGLENLTIVQAIQVYKNDSLESLNGLESLELVELSLQINQNENLTDLCGISNLIIYGNNQGNFTILSNAFNPTFQDIMNGNCKQD